MDGLVAALLAIAAEKFPKRLLLMAALLAGEFHADSAFCRGDAIGRAAFSAGRLNAGIALLNSERLARHGFADEALGLFPHRLLRHPPLPVRETPAKQPYSTCIAFFETAREKSLWNRFDAVFGVNPVTRSTSAGPMPI